MSSENQYISLFEEFAPAINKHSCNVMNVYRDEAMSRFKELGFPPHTAEDYRHTDIPEAFAPDFGMNLNQIEIPVDPFEIFRCDVPNLSTSLYFLVNDTFCDLRPKSLLPKGVLAGSLRTLAQTYPELTAKFYHQLARNSQDGTVAFNTAFAQDGFFLYIPRGVIVEKPIQLVNVLRSDVDFLANRRILIVVEEGAQAKLLVCDHTINNVHFLSTQVCEIFVGEGATFDYYEIEETTLKTKRIATTFVSQQARSNVLVNGITLHNGMTRNNYFLRFEGENAEAHLCGMAIGDQNETIDNFTYIDHAVPRCSSRELFKYVLNDTSTGSFSGRILVREGAVRTEAYQNNKNLCATSEAQMFTKPQLEIYADDVKCSHGATIGQLDEQALFYMRSRGIPEEEARMLLMFAFTSDVIDTVRLDALKDRLRLLVEKRFRGELAKCSGCRICQ